MKTAAMTEAERRFHEGTDSEPPANAPVPSVYHADGRTYRVLGLVRNSTNGADRQWMVHYVVMDGRGNTEGQVYLCELQEFVRHLNGRPATLNYDHDTAIVPPGVGPYVGIYRHYKGGIYRTLGFARTSTRGVKDQWMVLYVSMTYGEVYAREVNEFTETILVNGQMVPRFLYLGVAKQAPTPSPKGS